SGLMIDAGIGVRSIGQRLGLVGCSWDRIAAVLLTHTHADHVSDTALCELGRRRIPFYCHDGHHVALSGFPGFETLRHAGLVRVYDERPFLAPNGAGVEPIVLSHDGGPTFGFRIEVRGRRPGRTVSVGFLTDTGCWTDAMADALSDVDLIGIEFN